MNEYVTRVIISFMTAGIIIMIIPILFFTIGHVIELQVTKREIDRYFEFWCHGVMGRIFPHALVLEMKQEVDKAIADPEQQHRDAAIHKMNSNLIRRTYIVCGLTMLLFLAISSGLAWYTHQNLSFIWFETFVGSFMFVLIEVVIILVLFKKYCPLDINMINKHILLRIM